jgi:hypothetical protein
LLPGLNYLKGKKVVRKNWNSEEFGVLMSFERDYDFEDRFGWVWVMIGWL